MRSVQDQRQPLQGLSAHEVEERRARGLGCVPPPATDRSYLRIIRENVLNTVNIILFSIALALVLLGQYLNALISVGVISFNMIISLIQEVRAKHTLDRIALLTRPKAVVLRDGREQQVELEAVVVGDILVMHPGDQIVVDGPVVGDGRVEIDESLLTGESDLMTKHEGDRLYSGTFCVTGSAYYRPEHVGIQSVAGTLTAQARAYRAMSTPLPREINLIIRVLLLVALFLEVLLFAASLVSFIPIVETVRMAMVIIGIVPNGLFLSISVAYALGAVRIAGNGALVQKFNASESLSHVDVLCTDKTGTLTANALELYEPHIAEGLTQMFVAGTSTHKVGEVAQTLLGVAPSASTISRLNQTLNQQFDIWRQRRLQEHWRVLYQDGIHFSIRHGDQADSTLILTALAVDLVGNKEVVALRVCAEESKEGWLSLLQDLRTRGATQFDLIGTSGHDGLLAAVAELFSSTPRQRCLVHKQRNILNAIPRRERGDVQVELVGIWEQPTKQEALIQLAAFKAKYSQRYPEAARSLAEDEEHLLTFYAFPQSMHRHIQSTNAIESLFSNVRQRTDQIDVFTTETSCLAIVWATIQDIRLHKLSLE